MVPVRYLLANKTAKVIFHFIFLELACLILIGFLLLDESSQYICASLRLGNASLLLQNTGYHRLLIDITGGKLDVTPEEHHDFLISNPVFFKPEVRMAVLLHYESTPLIKYNPEVVFTGKDNMTKIWYLPPVKG